ncbi:hypothetical protein V6N13_067738 [Hibiscus sabdariffa]|uniref:Uncharacterized protein n=1 Tax=Hibiscus sabdariffa TaxID=183260 RepID=A0ABR2DXN0_9ROSI
MHLIFPHICGSALQHLSMATGDDCGRSGRRGRPRHDESPDNQREKKRVIDKQARLENRDVLVELTEAAPQIKQMLEAFNSVNIGELKEAMEGLGTVSDGTKEIKVLVEQIKDGLREAATMAPRALCEQCNQNLGQGTAQIEAFLSPTPCLAPPPYPARFDENDERFYQEVENFFLQWNGNTKRQGAISDFQGLQEETNEHGFPPSLRPIQTKIMAAYGDITRDMTLSDCAALPTIIKFYATVKNMDELRQVEDVCMEKLRRWRDAIIDAQQIGLIVPFAEVHLKRIAHAYVASKPGVPTLDDQKKKLEAELDRIGKMLEQQLWSRSEATVFRDKPLNAGLFPDEVGSLSEQLMNNC